MSTLRLPDKKYAALVAYVLKRDKYRCRSCGMRSNLHVHHIWFRSQRGPDEAWNLITLCSSCHDGVHKDIKDGQYGLKVIVHAATGDVQFIRRAGWKPQ